jgi:N-methylhydantoinase B/oxoprolinase/acetone carboxylase alpha subunit
VFQEGLRLPWVRLISGGTVIDEVMRIIESNVRLPEMTQADLSAQLAACAIAERSLLSLSGRYGADRLEALCTRILGYAKQLVTRAIEALPDGTAEQVDYLDSDGISRTPVTIRAAVTIRGGKIIVDLSGSDPLAAGALNCTRSVTAAVTYHAVLSALKADVPQVEGAFWPIEVVTAPGTVAEVTPPAASSQRGVTAYRIYDTVIGALAQLIPGLPATGEGGPSVMTMTGLRRDGGQFVYHDNVVGAWGASPDHDGNDGLSNPCAPVSNISVETAEQEFPLRIEEYALVPDSGGPGQHRGGCAVRRSWRVLADTSRVQVRADRQDHVPRGLDGAGPGSRSATWIAAPDGQTREMAPMFASTLRAGDLVIHHCAGGGGWGDPRYREPQAIARDLAEGKLTAAAGQAAYGTSPHPGPAATEENGGDR